MPVAITYPHIEAPPGEPFRLKRLPRIRVAQFVMDRLAHGWSVEELCRKSPRLTPAEAHAAMLYYRDHQETIDAVIRDESRQVVLDRPESAPSPFWLRMKSRGLVSMAARLFLDQHVSQAIAHQSR